MSTANDTRESERPAGYVTALVLARQRISEAREKWLKQQPQPGMSDDNLDKWNMMTLAYGNGLAAARSLLGGMLDETRESHTAALCHPADSEGGAHGKQSKRL